MDISVLNHYTRPNVIHFRRHKNIYEDKHIYLFEAKSVEGNTLIFSLLDAAV